MLKYKLGVHIYPTNFKYETRMQKIIKTLLQNNIFDKILVLGLADKDLPRSQYFYSERCEILRLGYYQNSRNVFRKGLGFLYWYFEMFSYLFGKKIDVINCHSLSVLPICVILKIFHKAKLVYEPHELETETLTVTGKRKFILKKLEKFLIKYSNYVTVVSDSILKRYKEDYNIDKIVTIFNVPEKSKVDVTNSNYLHYTFNINSEDIIFLYQGLLESGRRVDLLVEIFKTLDKKHHIIFMGFGKLENEIIAASGEFPNIHFLPAVNPDELVQKTADGDVGIVLLDNSCLNHDYALPNKFFQYLNAGIAVLASDLVEMRTIINKYECGWYSNNTFIDIKNKILELDSYIINEKKHKAQHIKNKFIWENETTKLVDVYKLVNDETV